MRAFARLIPVALFATLAAILIGCGGGGGGGSTDGSTSTTATTSTATTSTSTTATTGITSIQIEAVDPVLHVVADAGSVHPGDSLQLRLWGRNTSGNIAYLTGAQVWATNAASSVATVSSSGLLQVVASSGTFTVTANGTTTLAFTIRAGNEPFITGKVRNLDLQGVPNAIIDTFNSNKTRVRSGLSGSDGTFRFSVPLTVRTFDLRFDNISNRYYNVWTYGEPTYSPGACPAIVPLPALTANSTLPLTNQIVIYRQDSNPPPAPDCTLP